MTLLIGKKLSESRKAQLMGLQTANFDKKLFPSSPAVMQFKFAAKLIKALKADRFLPVFLLDSFSRKLRRLKHYFLPFPHFLGFKL